MMTSYELPNSLILKENDPREKYDPKTKVKGNVHLGQLKLFTNELVFILCHCLKDFSPKQKIILYIGAGPGNHLIILARMFPQIEWHLYDYGTRFDDGLSEIKNVKIFPKYFEDDDIKSYKNMIDENDTNLFFISDIRDLSYDSDRWTFEEELKTIDNMNFQKRCVEMMRPKWSMLKFRLPFPEKQVIEKLGTKTKYFDGIVYKQPWAQNTSSETRIVVPENFKTKFWDLEQYEQQLYFHNTNIRQNEYNSYYSDFIGKKINKKLTFTNKYDFVCVMEALHLYFTSVYGKDYPVDKIIKKSENLIDRLSIYEH